ncbi:MAG: hypothetical protein EA378_05050 [Phycisphaerales bacterium]|nr:MAG: hypothetical protein EA378_05050 [Phycisphaerales bacterium]
MELMADEALQQLEPESVSELASLRAQGGADLPAIDAAIGALILTLDAAEPGSASADPGPELPTDLAARVTAIGQAVATARVAQAARPGRPVAVPPTPPAPTRRSSLGPIGVLGWMAAAAGFALAAVAWLTQPKVVPVTPPMVEAPAEPTPAEGAMHLADRLSTEPGTLRVAFQAAGLIEGRDNVGEVLWNPDEQRGLLRIRNIDPNDPAQHQFQLWIFDAEREQYAVDGGVFDIGPATPRDQDGNLLVPFEPRLAIRNAAAFAVTQEQPGGVVVTDQSGLILLGPVGG